ncbi:MAG: hypothetical protein ACYSWT_05460 [Planctomycetota bacterium]|jgi:hypothetical protein
MARQRTNGSAAASPALRQGDPDKAQLIDVELPRHVHAKWVQARREIEAKAGRPLEDWQDVKALVEAALSTDGEHSAPR